MTKPIIGITTGRYNHATPRNERQTSTVGIPEEYLDAVIRSGGAPVLLPRTAEGGVVSAVLEGIDGLLLSGGGDVVSLTYDQEPHPASIYQDPVRDSMELTATRLACKAGVPILGICRGIQLLNVALGGTLVQDIASRVAEPILHYTKERDVVLAHTIDIEPDSLLADVLGVTKTAVNSWHHQSVDAVAPGLRVNCRARDGVVEGVEADDGRPVLALQCHPEDCAEEYPLFQNVFNWLVAEAGGPR